MIRKKFFLFNMMLLLIIIITEGVSCANIGVSPANIFFENVLRGGYSEKGITISIDTDTPTEVNITVNGEIARWVNLSENYFSVSKNNPKRLIVSVTPPADTPNGNYSGFLRIRTSSLGSGSEGHATSVVSAALELVTTIEVTDIEFRDCRVTDYRVLSVESGDDVVFNVDVENLGNIEIRPRVDIDIWDQEQITILKKEKFSDTLITPTKKATLTMRVPTKDFSVGQYWSDVYVIDCYSSQTLTFDILEPGALRANGIITRLYVKPWSEVKENIPIIVDFKNIGEKAVEASFNGKVTLSDRIIEIIETEKLFVPVQESVNFTFYFTPKIPGKYVVSGRVIYSGKRTFEASGIMNVKSQGFSFKSLIMPAVYLLLFLLIAFLLYKIRRERKKYMNQTDFIYRRKL